MGRGEVDRSWGQGRPQGETQGQAGGQGHRATESTRETSSKVAAALPPMSQSPWSGPESPRPRSPAVRAEEAGPHTQELGNTPLPGPMLTHLPGGPGRH